MPEDWRAAVATWSTMLARHRREIGGAAAPEPELEWLFYQALAGAWPADLAPAELEGVKSLAERIEAYMLKVVREAKVRTSWTAPAEDYEAAIIAFVRGAFSTPQFLEDFCRRSAPLWLAGAITSLSQLATKLAAPGIPDIYQGTEFWDLSLVDPDNRRPLDFSTSAAALEKIDSAEPRTLLADWRSGKIKMRLMQAGLALRRDHPALFTEGEYLPLATAGAEADRLVAFARRTQGEWLILVATRLPLKLLDGADEPLVPPARWGDTHVLLPDNLRGTAATNVLTGEPVSLHAAMSATDLLAAAPVALLHVSL
jgi:(1->4)-alpha-D-glucan 1-alpha-D-glucosylmutase